VPVCGILIGAGEPGTAHIRAILHVKETAISGDSWGFAASCNCMGCVTHPAATADEGAFLKLVATELYGIPSRKIHGSSIKLKYGVEEDVAKLIRTSDSKYLDNWDGKPRLIFQTIGMRPIFAAGNSNGDLHMLQYTSQQDGPSMSVLIHHTDGEREYAYNKHTEKVMPLATKEGWTVVDMKKDWKTVFSE